MLTALRHEILTNAAEPAALSELSFSTYRQFFDTGRRLDYERRYFARRARLATLAAAALLDPQQPLDDLADLLWSVCDEYTWALPAHVPDATEHGWPPEQCVDLFACETAHTLAESVALFGTRLDPRVSARVTAEIQRRVLEPLQDPRPLAWEGFGNNWEAVCAGAAGMAALALLPDGETLSRLLSRCRAAMTRFVDGYGSDGGCPEGIDYWVYGFGYFVYFSEALRDRTGEDLMAVPKIRQIAAFPQRVALGGGAYVPFSDASERPMLPLGLMTRLAERFGTAVPELRPGLHDDHCYRWAHLSRTLSWSGPKPAEHSEEQSSYLPDLAWVVDRGDYAFAAKGGHNDEPHNHNDLGHFVLHVRGQSVLDDLGAGEYTRTYFEDGRYLALHPSAQGHSVPMLDGRPQLAGQNRRATVLHHRATDEGVEFDLELSSAYDVAGLESLIRRFRWHRSGRLELTDELTCDRDLTLDELFISRHRPVLIGDQVTWADTVRLRLPGLAATVEEIATTDHHGRPDTVFRLRLSGLAPAGRSAHRFEFLLDR